MSIYHGLLASCVDISRAQKFPQIHSEELALPVHNASVWPVCSNTKCITMVAAFLRRLGVQVYPYLDDWLVKDWYATHSVNLQGILPANQYRQVYLCLIQRIEFIGVGWTLSRPESSSQSWDTNLFDLSWQTSRFIQSQHPETVWGSVTVLTQRLVGSIASLSGQGLGPWLVGGLFEGEPGWIHWALTKGPLKVSIDMTAGDA